MTASPVLIITNAWRTLNEHVTALEDRGHLLHFEPPMSEVHARVATWFGDQDIYDFIGEHLHLVDHLSMPLYHSALELKRAGFDWRASFLENRLSDKCLLVATLRADPSFATEEARVSEFTARGGGSRAAG